MQRDGSCKNTSLRPRWSFVAVASGGTDRVVMCVLWWLMLCYFTVNTVFLSVLGREYLSYLNVDSSLRGMARNFLFSSQLSFLAKYHTAIGVAYAVIATPFAGYVGWMLWYSIKRRQLAFGPASGGQAVASKCWSRTRWFSPELRLVVSETLEVTLQFNQGFHASKNLSNPMFSQLYGAMILVNCCSTPVIMYCCEKTKQSAKTTHLMCALTNSVLALAWGTALQGILYIQFLKYNDTKTWPSMVPETYERELGQVLVVSIGNFVSSTFTFATSAVGMLNCMHTLNKCEDHESTTLVLSTVRTVRVIPGGSATSGGKTAPHIPRITILLRWWYILMILFGSCVFVASMGATGKIWKVHDSTIVCLDQLYPWFVTDVACVGRQINCTLLQISGDEDTLKKILGTFSTYLLANLAIVDCPAVEMPSSIQGFEQLETLTLVQCTVLKWDTTAAIDDEHFPALKTLSLHWVEFVTVPTGIVSQPLPASFEWMYAEHVNADTFVDQVGDNWSMTVYFYCRSCNLNTIPETIRSMSKLQTAQFQWNTLATVQDDIFADKPDLTLLILSSNPLTELPDSLWTLLSQLWWLDLEHTNVSNISASGVAAAMTNDFLRVYGFGTPLCGDSMTTLLPATKLSCLDTALGW